MPYELPPDPRSERRARVGGWVSFAFAALLVILTTYLGYVGFEGSRQLTHPPGPSADCRTPIVMGWAYEAINYDAAADDELARAPDPTACEAQGTPAGDALIASDGVPIAGWYIPAAADIGPTGPTVVLSHGWGSNKSNMLERAAVLHASYNVVAFDYRNHGQSGPALTTVGVTEQEDLLAVVDWLVATKGPDRIAVLGVSMGGATAAAQASRDSRVDALILESTHATLANAAQKRMERAGYPLSLPGSWAILMGALIRTGIDVTAADPIQSVERLDGRAVLLVDGGEDDSIGETDAEDLLAAAEAAGSSAELQVCLAAGHGASYTTCEEEYASWVLGFLQRALGPPS
ncbi:MAG: alpha/beta hydrolase [Candidatus Limnocylindria bacterium]